MSFSKTVTFSTPGHTFYMALQIDHFFLMLKFTDFFILGSFKQLTLFLLRCDQLKKYTV